MQGLVSRRTALAGMGALAVGGSAKAAGRWPFFNRVGVPLGVQLYTLAPDLQKDFQGTLQQVAGIGFKTVELAGFLGRTAVQLRSAFDQVGLQCTSAHVPAQPLGPGGGDTLENVSKLIEDAQVLGLKYIVLPLFPLPRSAGGPRPGEDPLAFFIRAGQMMEADDWRACADLLNIKAAALHAAGLQMAYHNHNFEFAPRGAANGFEILMERTDPKLVSFEMDAGWVAAAGFDPLALLKRYPGRFRLMHVKDIKASTKANFALQQDPTEVGSGRIPWARILPAAYAAGVRNFFVEQEPPFSGSRLASIEKSYRYLMSLEA
jgi:sugar phosphate isomerase/epimerase